jgi:hypothetical protein
MGRVTKDSTPGAAIPSSRLILSKADDTKWLVEGASAKLALRAGLPGARVFDLAAESLRKARATGLPAGDRLALALPASWCVNNPAPSSVLRRWALPPQQDVWLSLIELLEEPRKGPLDAESREAVTLGVGALAPEPYGVEAVSKVAALLVPDGVPLMPPPARAFVLGEAVPLTAPSFAQMIDWFAAAVDEGGRELASWAGAHREVPLSAAQALDRLLWFDSEGHRHFPSHTYR